MRFVFNKPVVWHLILWKRYPFPLKT